MHCITIATAPCSWGVWYADGTPSGTPYSVFLDQAASAGYRALELGPDGYLPSSEQVLSQELSARGLSVCAGTACYSFDQGKSFSDFRPQVKALCERLARLGAKYLVTMDESDVGNCSERKGDFAAEIWNNFFGKIKEMGQYTKEEFGIETVYHPHVKSMIEFEDEIIRLMDHTGLNLCFDTGHHIYANAKTPYSDVCVLNFMRKYASRIAYLHFKQLDAAVYERVLEERLDSDTAFDINVMCDLPDGAIDFAKIKRLLDEIAFSGIAVVESDMPRASTAQAFASAKRNLEYLRSISMID